MAGISNRFAGVSNTAAGNSRFKSGHKMNFLSVSGTLVHQENAQLQGDVSLCGRINGTDLYPNGGKDLIVIRIIYVKGDSSDLSY